MSFFNQEIALAHRLADAAGDIQRRYFRAGIAVESKSDASPVTIADRECESAMRALIEKEFPNHGIVGEEHGNVREDSPWQWVLDPIDGTRSFIAGFPTFCTLIALAKDGVPVMGVIDQPISRERWVGVRGQSTACNGKPVSTRAGKLSSAAVTTTSLYHFSPAEMAAYARLRHASGNVAMGGDAYAYAMLASGQLDIVVDVAMKPFDFCALVPVIEGAGGVITDWNGKPLTLASGGTVLAAAGKALHAEALALLRQP